MSRVLHIVAARFKPAAGPEEREQAVALAHGLAGAAGVEAALVAVSEQRLIAAAWLPGPEALEPFAASPEHMSFVMRGLAPAIERMWSASIATDAGPPEEAAALWVFALGAEGHAFEWQVRELLDRIEALPGTAAAGVTIEERDRYRAAGLVSLRFDEVGPFEAALTRARPTWVDVGETLEEASAPVAGGGAG